MPRIKTCPTCHGSGKVEKWTGAELRKKREAAGFGLNEFARLLGVPPPYLSDIELGKRNVTPHVMRLYKPVTEENAR